MKLIHSTPDRLLLGHLTNLLRLEEIPYETRHDTLGAVTGDVPAQETWAELWVDEAHEEFARAIVGAAVASPSLDISGPWTCACGERLEGEFDACWNCGKERAPA